MLAQRLEQVRARIERAATSSGRDPADVTIVAVSKFQPLESLQEAYALGVRDFGESRIDELREKAVSMPSDVRWHFVGAVQSNKATAIREAAHLVHSFDRPEKAEAWKGARVLLQVNIGQEPQKRGVAPQDVPAAIGRLVDAGVRVEGLMCLPPRVDEPEDARPHFRALRRLRDECRMREAPLSHLSMGMSSDVHVAVSEGATLVRVGIGIFGPRANAEAQKKSGDHSSSRSQSFT